MIYVASLTKEDKDNAVLEGKSIITSISQVYKVITQKTCMEITFKDDFLKSNFNTTGITVFLKELKRINPLTRIIVSKNYEDYFTETMEMVQNINSSEDFLDYALKNTEELLKTFQFLVEKYSGDYNEALSANNKIATMQLEIAEATQAKEDALAKRDNLSKMYSETNRNLEILTSRINTSIGQVLDPEKSTGITVTHSNYDRILYIKEISRVRFTDTLIFYLQEIMKAMYGVSVRFLVMEAPYAYSRLDYYPNCKSHLRLSYNDVITSDIFVPGYQQKLTEDILRNPVGLPYLIVLDRTMSEHVYIRGEKVVTIYTASDYEDLKSFVPLNRIISYSKETLYINYIKNFKDLQGNEKLSKYSSMRILLDLVNMLEGVEQNVKE